MGFDASGYTASNVCKYIDPRHAIGVYRRLIAAGHDPRPESGPVHGVVKLWFGLPSELMAPEAFSTALAKLDSDVDVAVRAVIADNVAIERCMAL